MVAGAPTKPAAAASKPPTNGAVSIKKTEPSVTDPSDEQQQQTDEQTEEASLVNALALLHQMHTKLTLLRQSIPHMIQPIMKASTYPSPESLFSEFSGRTLKASEDLVEFTTLVSDGRWVFEKAARSRKEEGQGEVRRWKSSLPLPVYLRDIEVDAKGKESEEDKKRREEEEKKKKEEAEKEREVEIEEVKVVESDEVRKEIVESYKKENEDLEVTTEEDGKLKIVLPKSLNLTFTIEMPAADAASNRYIVTLPTSSYLHILILRSVTTRPNAGSLKYLLEMIATYKTIYKTKCTKCNKLTNGPKADLPVVRRLRKTVKLVKVEKKPEGDKMDTDEKGKGKDGKAEEEEEEVREIVEENWMAYHEGCVASA